MNSSLTQERSLLFLFEIYLEVFKSVKQIKYVKFLHKAWPKQILMCLNNILYHWGISFMAGYLGYFDTLKCWYQPNLKTEISDWLLKIKNQTYCCMCIPYHCHCNAPNEDSTDLTAYSSEGVFWVQTRITIMLCLVCVVVHVTDGL